MDKKIFIIPLILISSVFCISFISAEWIPNFELNSSIPVTLYTKATVFNISNDYYMIRGLGDGLFDGFSWNGTDWVSNSTIITGLTDVGQYATPDILIMGDTINLIVGQATGLLYVFSLNVTTMTWAANSSLRNGINTWDVGSYAMPAVLDNSSRFMVSNSDGLIYGASWNGNAWAPTASLWEGLVDYGDNLVTIMDFYYNNEQYLITFNGASGFKNFNASIWNGTQWLNDTSVVEGIDTLTTNGFYEGNIFEINGTNYMLIAERDLIGEYLAFEWFINPYELTDCKTSGWVENETYVLQNDLPSVEGSCFNIDADYVTLDLGGYTITGDGTGEGIYIENQYNIIKNGVISSFEYSIFVGGAENSEIRDITLINNINGIYSSGSYNSFLNISILNSDMGIYSYEGDYNIFENITVFKTGDVGIYLLGSDYNTFNIINSSENGGWGIGVGNIGETSSTNNNFSNIITNDNSDSGIYVSEGSDYNTFINITSSFNGGGNGIVLYLTNYNLFTNIITNSNVYDGIYLDTSDYNNFTNVISNDNGWNGIWLAQASNYNTFTNVELNSNDGGHGFYSDNGDCNYLTFNNVTANENFGSGIYALTISSSFTNITANSNTENGIWIDTASGDSSYNNFTDITTNLNNLDGILHSCGGASSYDLFVNIETNNNIGRGVYTNSCDYSNYINVIANYNQDGFVLWSNNYNTLNNITTISNGEYGIEIYASTNNDLSNIVTNDNNEDIKIIDSSDVIFSNIEVDYLEIDSSNVISFFNYTVADWTFAEDVGALELGNNEGKIYFYDVLGTVTTPENLQDTVGVNNNFAFAYEDGFDVPANITFYNMPQNFTNPAILRDGVVCEYCVAYTSLNADTVIFEVQGFSNYTIDEAPDTTPPYFADSFEWLPNSTVNSTLNNYFWSYSRPNVFNISDNWYVIVGNWTGTFTGFQWENGEWVYNSTITSGLSGTSYASTPNVFSGNFMGVDGTWMIAGGYYSTLYGYKWNGYGWTANSTLITGLIARNSPYSNDHATPNVFQIGNDWYFLNGHYSGLIPEYAGFAWDGSQWSVNSTITNGYPIDGATITVSTFDWQGDKYMVMGGLTANTFFKTFRIWNGTGWDIEFELNATGFSPEYNGPSITPSAYVKDGNLYLIEGGNNKLYGYSFEPFIGLPNDSSFFYGNESLRARFNGEDDVGFITYSVNDSRFAISSIGLLTETSALSPNNYQVNVTITDTAGNINWTLHNIEVKINPGPCNVYINQTSHFVWTDCSSPYQMYVNGTAIFNASTINLGAGYYNITVQRNDAVNYSNTVDTGFLTVPQLVDPCSIYFDKATPQMYPDNYTVYTDCSTDYNLSKDGVPISNGTTYALSVGTSNFTVQRTDVANYTYVYDTELFSIIPNDAGCSIFFDKTSPLTYPDTFNVWTNCDTAFTLFRDGTPISNYSGQALNAGTYNFTVQRTDTFNYSNIYSSSLFTIVEADEGHRGASEGTFISVPSTTTGADIFGTVGTNRTNLSNYIDLSKLEDIDGKEILANLREWFRTNQWAYVIVGMLLIGGLISLLNRK